MKILSLSDMTPQEAVSSFFRRPGMSDMRKLDAEMYVVLGMRWGWDGLGRGGVGPENFSKCR